MAFTVILCQTTMFSEPLQGCFWDEHSVVVREILLRHVNLLLICGFALMYISNMYSGDWAAPTALC